MANRVSKIQEFSEIGHWHYINTKANPADYASRGLLPDELRNNELWWHGPSVLLNEQNCAPEKIETKHFETQMEAKQMKTTVCTASLNMDFDIINKFSSFNRATRAMAFCKKYLNELKKRKMLKSVILDNREIRERCNNQLLTVDELEKAKIDLIKRCQENYFGNDMQKLKEEGRLSKDSRLKPLYPF